MGARAPLILALSALAAFAGCAGEAGPDHPPSDMGIPSNDQSASCAVVSVQAFDESGKPTDRAPARLVASVMVQGGVDPMWTVWRAGDSTTYQAKPTDPPDPSGQKVQIDAPLAGTWTVTVSFASPQCTATGTKTLLNGPPDSGVSYRLRAIPPESAGYPLTETPPFHLMHDTPLSSNITLQAGVPLSGVMRGPGGVATEGEVRLIAEKGKGPDAVTVTDASGVFALALRDLVNYTPLLIPKSPAWAPSLGVTKSADQFVSSDFSVGAGATVTGTVADDGANPLEGAHVVLRADKLPSGTGVSDASGNFKLHAQPLSQPQTYALSFAADGWPEGSLPNVSVPSDQTIAMRYTISRVLVSGTVVASDGIKPVPHARVTITSQPLDPVADVTIGGITQHATGRVARVVEAGDQGTFALSLPAGKYGLIVEPPTPGDDGPTTFAQTVSGAASWKLQLRKQIPLTVTISDEHGNAISHARVTAIETLGLGAAPSVTTDDNGKYTIKKVFDPGPDCEMVPGASCGLQLLVEPPADVHLAGKRLWLRAGTMQAPVTLDPGVMIEGYVLKPGTFPPEVVPQVRIEAYCLSLSCDMTTPVATTTSDSHGYYRIYLPDPGAIIIVDGGGND